MDRTPRNLRNVASAMVPTINTARFEPAVLESPRPLPVRTICVPATTMSYTRPSTGKPKRIPQYPSAAKLVPITRNSNRMCGLILLRAI